MFPGSFVMLRAEGASERWNVPLCVMRAKDSYLDVLIEVQGPKTVALDRVAVTGAGVNVTGPFWSGILGMDHLRNRAAGPVLAFAKGVGQAALRPVAGYVADRGGSLKALIGPGPLGSTFSMEAPDRFGRVGGGHARESDSQPRQSNRRTRRKSLWALVQFRLRRAATGHGPSPHGGLGTAKIRLVFKPDYDLRGRNLRFVSIPRLQRMQSPNP